jgi:hypothetical protein
VVGLNQEVPMTEHEHSEPKTRRERLAAIAAEYTEEINDRRTERQMAGSEPVSRFAAITSEGSPESSHASNGHLLVADDPGALAELLRGDCGEGWLAHGRVWDLDVPFDLWGNLEVSYSVRVGEECTRPIQLVRVEEREDGIYLFDDLVDAEAFQEVVRHHGGEAELSEEPLHDNRSADQLIDAERGH